MLAAEALAGGALAAGALAAEVLAGGAVAAEVLAAGALAAEALAAEVLAAGPAAAGPGEVADADATPAWLVPAGTVGVEEPPVAVEPWVPPPGGVVGSGWATATSRTLRSVNGGLCPSCERLVGAPADDPGAEQHGSTDRPRSRLTTTAA